MNLAQRFRTWRAARSNTEKGKETSGRETPGGRDRLFRLSKEAKDK